MNDRRWARRLALLAIFGCAAQVSIAAEPMPPHERLRVQSRVLGETRRVNVYLPPDYDACVNTRYPVLYLPDGGEEEDFPHVARAADALIRDGSTVAFVIVGIENTDRRRDMTPQTQDPQDLKVTAHPGGAAKFRQFVAGELMPLMHARYRLTENSAVMGESLAGLWVIDTLLHQPATFNTYVALDPSLWWNQRATIRDAPQLLRATAIPGRRLIVAGAGQEGNGDVVAAFAQELTSAAPAVKWTYRPEPGLRHDTIYRALNAAMLSDVYAASPGAVPCVH